MTAATVYVASTHSDVPVSATAAEPIRLVDGGSVAIGSPGPMLLAFLDPAAPGGSPSRSQIPVLRSMATQYGRLGLTVLIVDPTGRASTDSLINFGYDWNLRGVAIATPDSATALRRVFQVEGCPDTLLIANGDNVVHRWRGSIATAQDLSFAIQALVVPPAR
ncbi:hypothetical protein [Nocardia sp. NPDC004722]